MLQRFGENERRGREVCGNPGGAACPGSGLAGFPPLGSLGGRVDTLRFKPEESGHGDGGAGMRHVATSS